jgi:uncharacterized protein YfaS (alpha-2-macroglobulin family)
MTDQMQQLRAARMSLGLALVSVLWLGAHALPALSSTTALPAKPGAGAATILLRSRTMVLAPNSSALLAAQVRDTEGRPVSGATVSFSANSGAVVPAKVVSDGNGAAEMVYTANSGQGQVVITAEANGARDVVYLEIRNTGLPEGSSNTVALAASADKRKPGEQATITVTVLDPSGNPVRGETVTLFGSLGEVSPASGVTDAAGKATSIFTAGNSSGQARIVALSGSGSGATEVQVIGASVATPTPVPVDRRVLLPLTTR